MSTSALKPAHAWLFHTLFTSWIHDVKLASLAMALATVAFWWFVCWLMLRLGWAIPYENPTRNNT